MAVGTCAIVNSSTTSCYANHLRGAPIWAGIANTILPVGPQWNSDKGTVESTHRAHTFYLDVWDRVIDGWSYIHDSGYHKSITVMLP